MSQVKDYDTEIALRLRQDVDFSHEGGSRKETLDDDGDIQVETKFRYYQALKTLTRGATATPTPMVSWSR